MFKGTRGFDWVPIYSKNGCVVYKSVNFGARVGMSLVCVTFKPEPSSYPWGVPALTEYEFEWSH